MAASLSACLARTAASAAAAAALNNRPARTNALSNCSVSISARARFNTRPLVAAAALSEAEIDDVESTGLVLVDHYVRLGVSPDATTGEIVKAFEERCLELTAAAGGLDEDVARQRLQALEVSLDVLTSEEGRRLYDWGLQRAQRGADADADYVWPFETDLTQKNYTPGVGTPPRPMAPEDTEGIEKLGYFFLGWFALSAVLSLTLY